MDYAEFLFDVLLLCVYAVIIAVLLSIAIAMLKIRFVNDFPGLSNRFSSYISQAGRVGFRKLDLTNLEKLLSEKRWQEADAETNRLMLWAAHAENTGTLTHHKLLSFPEETLMAMDASWAKHSNGRFGFNRQRQIYLELGMSAREPYQENEIIREKFLTFADYVGWRVDERYLSYNELTFDITAPYGHLPACKWLFPTASEIHSDESRLFYRAKSLIFLVKRW